MIYSRWLGRAAVSVTIIKNAAAPRREILPAAENRVPYRNKDVTVRLSSRPCAVLFYDARAQLISLLQHLKSCYFLVRMPYVIDFLMFLCVALPRYRDARIITSGQSNLT